MSDKKIMKCYLLTAHTNNMHVLKLAPNFVVIFSSNSE